MKAAKYTLAYANKQYVNEHTLSTGTNIVLNTSVEKVPFINRVMVVVDAPEGEPYKEGDEIVVHHNILRRNKGYKNFRPHTTNKFQLDDDGNYYVPPSEVFLWRSPGGTWKGVRDAVFIRPHTQGGEYMVGDLVIKREETRLPFHGTIEFINDELLEMGLCVGDLIIFRDDYNEYEFERLADGPLYKMTTSEIMAKVDAGTIE